ncbi:MAG: twin-arginine translocation signal domain-containing protein, partial [Verrucomicrobiae bacterium]|nr:twin-arginine translocation signal domain-containing protein [Verrucomicrobiae bacterium]
MSKISSISRRKFLGASAAALAMPTIIPASALGKGKRPAPSNRINVAAIGFGTIAYNTVPAFLNNDNVQLVAVADPNRFSGQYGYQGERVGGRFAGVQLVNEYYAKASKVFKYRGCNA